MSDIIHLLPDSVANQIAAGEVIQRPASVIKELVENAVDAGATTISIFIKDAGRTLIQVIDDGKGMSATDARMAFERHATSKINTAADLSTLATMGFRGEALPSICAISQVELRTRTEDDRLGTVLTINCSKVESQEPCVCERGANFMIKNIFCNLPARRKFIKSDSVELAAIMREFEKLALVNHNLHLTIDTGQKKLDLRPASFRQRIADIWKNNLNQQLLPVEVDTSIVRISGFISRPEFARRRNPLQYLIVNGRNMRHPYLRKAILNCYDALIAPDTQPCFFIRFEVDPASIDVNISPTKSEIKFENEEEIWRILSAGVRAALGKFGAVPSIDFTSDALPAAPPRDGEFVTAPAVNLDPGYNPFAQSQATSPSGMGGYSQGHTSPYRATKVDSNWGRLYDEFMAGMKESKLDHSAENGVFNEENQTDAPAICIQHAEKYIVTSTGSGLVIIDQHRAHVRILYEQYLASARNAAGVGQRVMFPQTLCLDPEQQLALEGVEDELSRIGFILSKSDHEGEWHIDAVPSVMKGNDPSDIILKILDSVSDEGVNYGQEGADAESMLRRVALVMARSGAITKGQRLSTSDMEHLVSRLFSLPDPRFTPSGNLIMHTIGDDRLSSIFR